MKKTRKSFGVSIVVGIVFVFIFVNIASAADKIELTQGQLDLINNLQGQGFISIEPNLNQVYIKPGLWQNMKYKVKENFAASLAVYCGNKKGTHLYWVVISDMYSGKKLAKHSHSWGFKVY